MFNFKWKSGESLIRSPTISFIANVVRTYSLKSPEWKKKKKRNVSYECYSLKLNGIFGECQAISVNFIKQRHQMKRGKKRSRRNVDVLSPREWNGEGLGVESWSKGTFVERERNSIWQQKRRSVILGGKQRRFVHVESGSPWRIRKSSSLCLVFL